MESCNIFNKDHVFEKNRKLAFELWERDWKHLTSSYTLSVEDLEKFETAKCDFDNRRIILANNFLNSSGCDLREIKLVFAHEVAHALIGNSHENDDGHNDAWKQKNIQLGGNGRIEDCMSSSYVENHYFHSRVNAIFKTVPQNQDISKEIMMNAQKKVMLELINEGHDPTDLLQMYMKEYKLK